MTNLFEPLLEPIVSDNLLKPLEPELDRFEYLINYGESGKLQIRIQDLKREDVSKYGVNYPGFLVFHNIKDTQYAIRILRGLMIEFEIISRYRIRLIPEG
jgi:hypothetical protein